MAYATPADLLARTNAQRLAQLAVPTDVAMVPLEVMRAALGGGDVSSADADTQRSAQLALEAVAKALADGEALMQSYGVPPTATGTMLTRMACTLAMYYLQGGAGLSKEDAVAYDGVLRLLGQYRRGEIDLTPGSTAAPTEPEADAVAFASAPPRYGCAGYVGDWDTGGEE